jgi:hypothetical protein
MTISRTRHIASMALGVFGACLVSGVKGSVSALLGGVFLGAGLGIGSIRRRREVRR